MSSGQERKEVLSVENLCVQAGGKTLLHRVTLDVWRGYVHAIVGPNGAGKSTLAWTHRFSTDRTSFRS